MNVVEALTLSKENTEGRRWDHGRYSVETWKISRMYQDGMI